MTTIDFTFATLGGDQQATLYNSPQKDAPIVLIAPALGIREGYYRKLCQGLAAQGLGAAAIDLPGQGVSPIRASRQKDWGYDVLLEHYKAACQALAALRPQAPLFLLGHSIGGQAALLLGGQDLPQLQGVILVASGAPYWRAWDGFDSFRIRFNTALCGVIAQVVGYFPGNKVGFGGREAKTLIQQWAQCASTGKYDFTDFPGEDMLTEPGPPVYAICLDGDTLAPEKAMRHVLDKMDARQKHFEIWETPPHGGNHNRWPSEPQYVIERVGSFIEETLTHTQRGAIA